MNTAELELKKRRAQRAEQLLKDELIKEAFSAIDKACYNTIKYSKHDQESIRQDAYMFARCLDAFKASFERIIRDGVETFQIPKDINQLKR